MPRSATPPPTTTLLEDAIDVPETLDADRTTPYPQRLRRDREIGRRLDAADPVRRVRAWRRAIGIPEGAGARLERIRVLVTAAMAVLGAITGTTLALAAFHYDGSEPVNVVRLLALLVGIPLLMLIASLLLLPGRVVGLRALQDLLAAANPGAWAVAVFRRLARPAPEVARMFDWHSARTGAGRFAKWQLLFWSQTAAVAFHVAALATAIVLVTFTDLAFGWSTTLEADPAAVTRAVQAIAWPWHAIAPSAVPSAALVEQSQFFRLDGGRGLSADASRALGGWWPFTIAAIVTYGLLPRLVLLLFSAWRLRAATAALLLDDPRVTALLDRMALPEIDTSSTEPPETLPAAAPAAPPPGREITGDTDAVIWQRSLSPDAARDYAARRLGLNVAALVEAGGTRALAADERAIEELASRGMRTLVIFTPAWEPPLLELLDFLNALRERLGDAASIIVTPVPGETRAVTDVEKETWARAVGKLRDPRMYVETGAA